MTMIIEVLREEHRNIERLLAVLEQELSVFDHRESPDYEILGAIVDYFEEFPRACHHPKEDMIYAMLKARDPAAAVRVGDLEADHRQGTRRLEQLAQAIATILTDHDMARQAFDDVVHDFIDGERAHIEREERAFFPAALEGLRAQDWERIEARLDDKQDPLFSAASDRRFRALQERILCWEEGNKKARARMDAPYAP